MPYVDLYFLDSEPDYTMVDGEKLYDPGQYYAVVEVPNKDESGHHWHVLLTQEQYDQRKVDKKSCITLTLADVRCKWSKVDTKEDYDRPIHVFGNQTHDPEIIAAKAEVANLLELEG
jgi:hypothetical protein